jgi:UDP-3-O-[3-hydroxymyristoyl] glucosamine N-acyltransferase
MEDPSRRHAADILGRMLHPIAEIAKEIGARLVGEGAVEVSGIASPHSATERDLVFAEDAKILATALQSKAGAIITGEFAQTSKSKKPLLVAKQPRIAFARAARIISPPRRQGAGVHSTAVVHHSAKLGQHVSIGPNVVIGEDTVIGDRTRIGPFCCIGSEVVIGRECFIRNTVTMYARTRVGDRVSVHAGSVLGSDGFGYVRNQETGRYEQFPQVGALVIGDDVEIGANVTIDRGALDATMIGNGTKIDNLVHIGHNVQIGENVIIAAQTGISGSSVIAGNAVLGGQVGIGDHARVEEGVILGSGSGVLTKKVVRGKGVVFWGRPARPLREYLKELATLGKLSKKTRRR